MIQIQATHYTLHILNTRHSYGSTDDITKIISVVKYGRYMDAMEKFHICCVRKENKNLNETHIIGTPIFKTI
jgi:hypothetical protein